jgi:hypothetical protein
MAQSTDPSTGTNASDALPGFGTFRARWFTGDPALLDRDQRHAQAGWQKEKTLQAQRPIFLSGFSCVVPGSMATAAPDRNHPDLAMATLGNRSRSSGNEKRLGRGGKTMLEPPLSCAFCAMEYLGLCDFAPGRIPHLGFMRWPGAKRWSFTTMWRSYRAAFWGEPEFQALWTSTGDHWWEKEAWLAGLPNSVHAAARI